MEILQTIWAALTTENEAMLNIISIPMVILEIFISTLLFTILLNIHSSKYQKIIYIMVFSLFSLFSLYIIPTPYNTFFNLIICPLLIFTIFRCNLLKVILAEFIPYILFVLIGSILLKIEVTITNLNYSLLVNIPIYKITSSLLMYFLVYIITKLLRKYNFKITRLDNMNFSNKIIFIINFLLAIVSVILQSYLAVVYANKLPASILGLNIFILIIYFLFTLFSLSRTIKLELTTQNLEEEKLYNKTLTILHDNIRGFKHDFNNTVQAIGGYISTNNMEGLKEYYNELLDDCQKVNNLSVLNPAIINQPALYSLLTSKFYSADELGIKMNIEVFIDLNLINMKIYEFSKVLGILLDNAIEASKLCNEKIIHLIIRNDEKQNRILVIVENTYSNKEVNVDKIFEKGYTSKENEVGSHGLGLWEVRQILKRNNNLNLYTSKDNKFFKQQLEIYNK